MGSLERWLIRTAMLTVFAGISVGADGQTGVDRPQLTFRLTMIVVETLSTISASSNEIQFAQGRPLEGFPIPASSGATQATIANLRTASDRVTPFAMSSDEQ